MLEKIAYTRLESYGCIIRPLNGSNSTDQVAVAQTPEIAKRLAASYNYCLDRSLNDMGNESSKQNMFYYEAYYLENEVKQTVNVKQRIDRQDPRTLIVEVRLYDPNTRLDRLKYVYTYTKDQLDELEEGHFETKLTGLKSLTELKVFLQLQQDALNND